MIKNIFANNFETKFCFLYLIYKGDKNNYFLREKYE